MIPYRSTISSPVLPITVTNRFKKIHFELNTQKPSGFKDTITLKFISKLHPSFNHQPYLLMLSVARHFLPLIIVIFLVASCQQEPDDQLPPPTFPIDSIPGPDSTFLIKQVTYMEADAGQPFNDSITENYTYDTVNRIITAVISEGTLSLKKQYYQSTTGQLNKVMMNYPSGYTPTGDDAVRSEFSYDGDGVLTHLVLTFGDGHTYEKHFVKTQNANGYTLAYESDAWPDGSPRIPYTTDFNQAGQPTTAPALTFRSNGSTTIYYDTLIYNTTGEVIEARALTPYTLGEDPRTFYTFPGRLAGGTQLSTLHKLIFGKALLFGFLDEEKGASAQLGPFEWYNGHYPTWEYFNHPATGVNASIWNVRTLTRENKELSFNSIIDDKGRLTQFDGVLFDYETINTRYKIQYYK
jgi:hypothetical protein